jgi:hypothetical protein
MPEKGKYKGAPFITSPIQNEDGEVVVVAAIGIVDICTGALIWQSFSVLILG